MILKFVSTLFLTLPQLYPKLCLIVVLNFASTWSSTFAPLDSQLLQLEPQLFHQLCPELNLSHNLTFTTLEPHNFAPQRYPNKFLSTVLPRNFLSTIPLFTYSQVTSQSLRFWIALYKSYHRRCLLHVEAAPCFRHSSVAEAARLIQATGNGLPMVRLCLDVSIVKRLSWLLLNWMPYDHALPFVQPPPEQTCVHWLIYYTQSTSSKFYEKVNF